MKKIALIFPGQGSHYIGMGKTLFDKYSVVKQVFEEANQALGYDLKNICFEGSLSKLNETEHMLSAILTTSVAIYKVFKWELDIEPVCLAGHSLGEYSALVCADAISFMDALELVQQRSILAVESKHKGRMTVVGNSKREKVEMVCRNYSTEDKPVTVGCYNSAEQFVISGDFEKILLVEDELEANSAILTPLFDTPPFHSPLLYEAAEIFKSKIEKVAFKMPVHRVVSNITAYPYASVEEIRKNLYLQLIGPVYWKETMDYLSSLGIDLIFEIGPRATLTNLVQLNNKSIPTISFGQKDDRENYLKTKSKKIDIEHYESNITLITRCLSEAVSTKNRNWNEDEYRKGIVVPYEELEKMDIELEKTGNTPDYKQMSKSLKLLKIIFNTKKVPYQEQNRRFFKIMKQTNTLDLFWDEYCLDKVR